MMARRSMGAGVLAVCLFGTMLVLGGDQPRGARAQEADDDPDVADADPTPAFEAPIIGPMGAQRFSLAPSGGAEGAVAFDELSGPEQEATDQAAEILAAGQPAASVAGWSAISRQHAERAAVRRAEYEAGVTGDVGVE
jgi:hypothetical protein